MGSAGIPIQGIKTYDGRNNIPCYKNSYGKGPCEALMSTLFFLIRTNEYTFFVSELCLLEGYGKDLLNVKNIKNIVILSVAIYIYSRGSNRDNMKKKCIPIYICVTF